MPCSFGHCLDKGVYGKDSPLKLFQTVLNNTKQELDHTGETLDAIIVTGDLIQHGFAPGANGVTVDSKFKEMQELFK